MMQMQCFLYGSGKLVETSSPPTKQEALMRHKRPAKLHACLLTPLIGQVNGNVLAGFFPESGRNRCVCHFLQISNLPLIFF